MNGEHTELVKELTCAMSVMMDEKLKKYSAESDARWEEKLDKKFAANDARWDEKLDKKFAESDARWDEKLDKKFAANDARWEEKLDKKFAANDACWDEKLKKTLDERFRESENMILSELDRVHESLIEHKEETKRNFEKVDRRFDEMGSKIESNRHEVLQLYACINNHEERLRRVEQKVS